MKKTLALLILISMALLSFASCAGKVAEEGNVTVVVESEDGKYEVYKTYLEEIENKTDGALAVIKHLSEREENPLHLVYSDGSYGAYITEIGSIKEDPTSGKYVMIYTTTETDSYADAPTVTYGEALLFSSGVGINLLSVEAGTIILFRVETFS